MTRPAFLDLSPPPGYVAGIGRGATGFSTRGGNKNKAIPKRLQEAQAGATSQQDTDKEQDKEDIEAEQVFAIIDSKRNGRNRVESKSKEETVINQFTDLKRTLKQVTEDEWLNIPEASDMTRRNKRNRLQEQLHRKTYAAPDTLLSKKVDLTTLTEEREKVLSKQLDVNFFNKNINNDNNDINSNGIVNDTEKYLNQLESIDNSTNVTQSEEIKKMRTIFQSYRKTMPKEPQGWIASARLEEKANKFPVAKKIINEGCQECPRSDSVWLENIRIHRNDIFKCKTLVATGIKFVPSSQKLWEKAIELESEDINKIRVIRKALTELPTVEIFWKLAVMYEKDKMECIRIIKKALEFLPQSLDLWKALVNMQSYDDAKTSLELMNTKLPNNLDVWIIQVQLEENNNDKPSSSNKIGNIFIDGFKKLEEIDSTFDYSQYITKAIDLENEQDSSFTIELFISSLFEFTTIDGNQLITLIRFIENLNDCLTKVLCLRELLIIKPTRYSLWKSLQSTCVNISNIPELYKTYDIILFNEKTGYSALKETPTLALLYAKDIWKYSSSPDKAIALIDQALSIIRTSSDVWFAKLKILCQLKRVDEVRKLFGEMFEMFDKENVKGKERLYIKYVSFLRYEGKFEVAVDFIKSKCMLEYPTFYKFYLQIGQIYENDFGRFKESIFWYSKGEQTFPQNSNFPISLSNVYIHGLKNIAKGRSILEMALAKSPQNETLYQSLIQLEKSQQNMDQVNLLIERALKVLPQHPVIWSEKLKSLSGRKSSTKKVIFKDALTKTKNNYLVLLQIAISFYEDGQYKVAEKWLQRAIKGNPQYGDSWIWLARTHQQLGIDLTDIYHKVNLYEPKYGSSWLQITKATATQYSTPNEVVSSSLL
ncbi:hypothetical protein C6P44_002857 [Monosporozyma unispora]|nr:hypothetical protein C6P44_002857 [Kazachstania unispora]